MSTTNAERADALARALRAALDVDGDTLRALCTADVRAWSPLLSTTSVDELVAELARRDAAFSEHALDVVPLDVAGDFACAEWTVEMTHTAAFDVDGGTVEATGDRVTVHGVTIAEFDGAKICALRQYWDEFAALQQLGVVAREPG